MKSLLLTILVLIILGCNAEKDDCCTIYSLDANISLRNLAGDDLLDPNDPNSYKERNIKVYHLINGVEIRSDSDNFIYQDIDSVYRYQAFVNYEGNDKFPITYIDWSETDRDTLKSEIYRSGNVTRAIKFWFNNAVVWEAENGGSANFTILK